MRPYRHAAVALMVASFATFAAGDVSREAAIATATADLQRQIAAPMSVHVDATRHTDFDLRTVAIGVRDAPQSEFDRRVAELRNRPLWALEFTVATKGKDGKAGVFKTRYFVDAVTGAIIR